uniref:perlucin-like protein n=1 Tax=Styela clava TaxID=7725 RepID=UPI001939E55B|nr:perlucin-like protein [Styela clava]
MKYMLLVIFVLVIITGTSAQEPWTKECVDGFELLFFKQRKRFNDAKSSCERLGGYLAKVDNENITAVINSAFPIKFKENTFFIGGNDIATEGDWKWQDGTDVIMRGETGYQNWFVS